MWQLFFAKAQSNLQAAERDRFHRAFDPCVSRAYFAAFQAAIAALLALADYRRRGHHWDHGEIAAEFTRQLIRQRKIFGGEIASILDDLKTRRHQADYSTVSMSDKIAQRTLDKARKLVELIGATLESTGGKRCIQRRLPMQTNRIFIPCPSPPSWQSAGILRR